MDWWLANFFLGAIFSLFLPVVPDLFVLISLLLLSLCFFYYPFHFTTPVKPLRLSSGLLFGASWMLFSAFSFQHQWQKNSINLIELSSKAQWVKGEVLSLHATVKQRELNTSKSNLTKTDDERSQLRFNLLITHLNHSKLSQAIKIRLSWKNAAFALQQGNIVNLKVKVKPAHGLANQGGFSYQTWLNSKAISATGYVIKHNKNKLVDATTTFRQQGFSDYSQRLLDEYASNELAPLLLALGFGSRTALSQNVWQVLQATGTGHLIAISGLHIGLVATGCFYLVMLLLRFIPFKLFNNSHQLQTINARYYAIGLSLLVAISYGYLAGFSLPTVRALVMLSFYWFARLVAIHISIKRWLLLTLFIITITTPFSLFTVSFWLSVYAVTLIFMTLWRFKHILNKGHTLWRFIKGLFVIQLSLTVMLLPVSALFFQQISVVAFFANIIAVPWMSFISIPLCLLSLVLLPISETLNQFFIMLCLESIQFIWNYLLYLSSKPWSVVSLSSLHVQLLVLGGLLITLWVFFLPKFTFKSQVNAKKGVMVCCFTLLIGFVSYVLVGKPTNAPKPWQLVVFDVGQGLSVLIQRGTKAILYDTGAAYDSGFTMVEAVVLPYLQFSGIKQLDKVIISHSDNDHAGGLAVLQKAIKINELIYNTHVDSESKTCLQGQSFYWQGLTFEMLWPEQQVSEENDDSCVILIKDEKHKVLLTGDISKAIEGKLIQQYPALQADVLVVPHHGSKTSSSAVFIEQVQANIAVVSAGFLNRWHMPVAEVVKRYKDNNVTLFNSAQSGQMILKFSDSGISYYSYHDDLWPFWFAKSP